MVESANEPDAFGSPMGSLPREKSRTPEGGRPARRRRVGVRPKGGVDTGELDDDPVMNFSDDENTEPAASEEAQRLAIVAARHASGVASAGSAPALPLAVGAAACG